MNHNGGDRYYMEEPGVDEEAEDRRREYEWNQYANRDSPHRSATEDYPRYEEERRRLDDRRDLREELNRDDCSSVYSNGSRSRSIPYRSRSRSPIRRRDRSGDREMRNDDRERSERSRWRNDDSPPYRRTYDRDDRRSPRERERRSSPYSSRSRDSGKDWSRRACPTVAIRYIPSSVVEVDIRDELRASRAHYIDLKMDYEEGPKNSSAAANHRVCYVEFETTRDAIQWMEEHQVECESGNYSYNIELSIFTPGDLLNFCGLLFILLLLVHSIRTWFFIYSCLPTDTHTLRTVASCYFTSPHGGTDIL